MKVAKPRVKPVVLDGTNLSEDVVVQGARVIAINPRSTVTVQVAFQGGRGNTNPEFFQLVSGQPFEADAGEGNVFEDFTLSLFAGTATTADVLWW